MKLRVAKLANELFGYENQINHSLINFHSKHIHLKFNNTIYPSVGTEIETGTLGIGMLYRTKHNLAFNDILEVRQYEIKNNSYIANIDINISCKNKNKVITAMHEDELKDGFRNKFKDYYLHNNQILVLVLNEKNFVLEVNTKQEGYLVKDTVINLKSEDVMFNLVGSKLLKRDLFKESYNFEEIGIGGLNKELINIFRRSLSTRAFNSKTIEKLGIKHVKGILLYGPPGTGKTLIARKIGGLISNREPIVVNGPEILDKYVGQSEQNMRNLFAIAKADFDTNRENADLHVIIFDEIDAICRARGKAGVQSNITDSLVSQLLAILDGVNAINNIFLIAMTNRKDLLDPALLRPGRIELHIEILFPNLEGRKQIFRIHMNNMKNNHMISNTVDVNLLAEMTENFSGAEIEAVVKNSSSLALHQLLSSSHDEINDYDIKVNMDHFLRAVGEITPAFGNMYKDISSLLPDTYLELTNSHVNCYLETMKFIKKFKRIKTILISSETGAGKTTMGAKIAIDSKITNTKFIKAINVISMDEFQKSQYLADMILDAYLTEESLVIIDDIEIIINYANLGNTISFSNKLYQTLLTILKTSPKNPKHSISILVLCGNNDLTKSIENYFDTAFKLDDFEKIDKNDDIEDNKENCLKSISGLNEKQQINLS